MHDPLFDPHILLVLRDLIALFTSFIPMLTCSLSMWMCVCVHTLYSDFSFVNNFLYWFTHCLCDIVGIGLSFLSFSLFSLFSVIVFFMNFRASILHLPIDINIYLYAFSVPYLIFLGIHDSFNFVPFPNIISYVFFWFQVQLFQIYGFFFFTN